MNFIRDKINIYLMTNINGSGGMGVVSNNLFKYFKDCHFNIKILNDKKYYNFYDPKGIFLRYGWRQDIYQTFSSPNFLHNINKRNKNIFLLSFNPNMLKKEKIDEINKNFLQIWCDSHFTANEARKAGICNKKIKILKLGVCNKNIFIKKHPKNGKRIRFVNISGHDMFFIKGIDILISVFLKKFKENTNIELYIKTNGSSKYLEKINNFITKEQERLSIYDYPKIIIDKEFIENKNIFNFLKKFDCYVNCSRMETFGLPLLEAISVGLPVICPKYGGHIDFSNKLDSVMIYNTFKKKIGDNKWRKNKTCFYREGCKKSMSDMVDNFIKNKFLYTEKAIENSKIIRNDWNWKKTLRATDKYLSELC